MKAAHLLSLSVACSGLLAACGSAAAPTAAPAIASAATPTPAAGYCRRVSQDLRSFDSSSLDPTTLKGIQTFFAREDAAIHQLEAVAPSAIAADWHTLRTTFDGINAGIQSAKSTSGAGGALQPFLSLLTVMKDIGTYTTSTCGVDLHLDGTSSPPSSRSSSDTTSTDGSSTDGGMAPGTTDTTTETSS
jgi:hypothetical protein